MLNLYVLDTCPYCNKVMSYFADNNIEYKKFEITKPDNLLQLLTLGGKEQVPFLYNDETNERLYESDEIINYMRDKKQV